MKDVAYTKNPYLPTSGRVYVFTLIDVYSRWVYTRAYKRTTTRVDLKFVQRA